MEESNKIVQIRFYAYIIVIGIYLSLGVYLIYVSFVYLIIINNVYRH